MSRKLLNFRPKLHSYKLSKKTCPNFNNNCNKQSKNWSSVKRSNNNWESSNSNFKTKYNNFSKNFKKSKESNLRINKKLNNSKKY